MPGPIHRFSTVTRVTSALTVCALLLSTSASHAYATASVVAPPVSVGDVNLGPIAAGALVRSVPIPGSGPGGSKGYTLEYASRSVAGDIVTVTGFAYIPAGTPPKGGWPVLSYAHGTVGLADRCAPSKKIGAVEQFIALTFTVQGIAVVATDYEGLGTPGRHPYLVGESEGRSVLDSVRAARQLPGESLSNKTIVWGHSQGGHAALFAGQLAKTWAPDLRLLGVVAGAPPSQLTDVSSSLTDSPYRGYLFMVVAGLQAANPSLNLDAVLTEKGQRLLPVVDTGCNAEVFKAFRVDPLDTLLRPDGLRNPQWSAALSANEPGNVRIPAPVLIVHGDRDEQIPVATSATLLSKMCRNTTRVQRKLYAGQDHAGAAIVSLFDVLAFVQGRLQGLTAPTSCRK